MAPRLDHPKNPAAPHFLQPSPCAYADDFAVAASSFRSLMAALSPAFVVDRVVGLNLNHRKCCLVQYGSDSCHELLDWVSTNCEEFREMKIVKYAKHVGTVIGPEGYLHRWTAPRGKSIQRAGNLNGNGFAKIRAAREFDLSPEWNKKIFKTLMAHRTMEAHACVRHLDHAGKIADSPSDKKQKAATALLRDAIQMRDFSLPIATRSSKILGPISRHLMAQILPMM